MRALLISPRSAFSFWSFPEICRFNACKSIAPPLGLITVAALLPREWKLRLVDLNAGDISEDDWKWADLIMISGRFDQRKNMRALIREATERRKVVVAGGPYPTSFPKEVLEAGAGFIVKGEGENTIGSFLEALKEGKRHGIFQNSERPEMILSPIPRYDLLRLNDYQTLSIQTSRGCPHNCEFCDVINLYGRKPRYKTPDQVLKELETIRSLGWRGLIFVADDNFIGSRGHARAILKRLIQWQKERGQPFGFMTQASIVLGQDRNMIDLLTAANFGNIFIGIESPDADVLMDTRKYHNLQNPLKNSVTEINKNGLIVLGSFMLGFDAERRGAGYRICSFVERANVPFVMINLLFAVPGTGLWRRLEREGRLKNAIYYDPTKQMFWDRMNFVPKRPESEIMKEYRMVWEYLYEPSRFFARVYRYFLAMRPTRRAMGIEDKPFPASDAQKRSMRVNWEQIKGFFWLIWLQGVRPVYRRQFWRQLFMMWRKNPSRVISYLSTCAMGQDMFRIRDMLCRDRRTSK